MPRRRRPPCKIIPSNILHKKSPDSGRRERERERERDRDREREYQRTHMHRQYYYHHHHHNNNHHHHQHQHQLHNHYNNNHHMNSIHRNNDEPHNNDNEEASTSASTLASASIFNDVSPKKEYKLFPELYNQQPPLPTFADIFGQPLPLTFNFDMDDMDIYTTQSGFNCPSLDQFINIPSSILQDDYGIVGILDKIQTAHTNQNIALLSIGEDLTCFGLDLAGQGDIYVHFNGPFTHHPPQRSSMDCALELGMRGMRDAIIKYPARPPIWEPFVAETRHLGLRTINSGRIARVYRQPFNRKGC